MLHKQYDHPDESKDGDSERVVNLSESPPRSAPHKLLALNLEFIAKPGQAKQIESVLFGAIDGMLRQVPGFAGSLLMISDQESRLVSITTFWSAADGAARCVESQRLLTELLSPYLDGRLRRKTCVAYAGSSVASPPGLVAARVGGISFIDETEELYAV
jgi:hypothetical protein